MVQISGKNSKRFWSVHSEIVTKIHTFLPFPKGEGLTNIEHNMSMGNLIWDVDSVTVSYLIYNDSPLQNATDIVSKCDSILLQNELVFILQNVTVLLQNATVITNCGNFITKCDSYYKIDV